MEYTKEQLEQMMKDNGGSLDLSGTKVTALPDNLTVGGWLDLCDTKVTALPDNLIVGGSLCLYGTKIKDTSKVIELKNGDYIPGRYIYADGILTHIKSCRIVGDYKLYVGKIKGQNVVSDGKYYAHCETLRDGIADIAFKKAAERGADQYRKLTLDSVVTTEEAIQMYRIITGACRQGTKRFVDSLGELKEKYTVREVIEITDGQYNSKRLKEFFSV